MRKELWKLLTLLVVLAMLAGLAACGPTPEPEVIVETVEVEKTVVETVEVEKEVEKTVVETVEVEVETEVEVVVTATPAPASKIVTFAWTQEPDSLNPAYTNMWFSSILQQIYLCWAWDYDVDNVPIPRLVTEIPSLENGGVTEDGLQVTMNLRDDIVWSDGTPITSADFAFTYEMIMDEGNTVSSQYPYYTLAGLETPDDQTVVMKFDEPFTPWLATFWTGIMPKHVMEPVYAADGTIDEADWNLAPTVGCGPFSFAEWESGSFMRFVANENYWLDQPNIQEIYLQFVPDDATQSAKMINREADLGTFPPNSDIPTLQAGGVEVMTVEGGYAEGWFFNFREMASPGAKDVVVRQAIAMALDRQLINDELQLGLTHPVETLWDSMAAYGYVSPDIVPWEYNPDAARQLLEDNGYVDSDGDGIREDKDGNPLTLIHGTTIREIRQDNQAVAQQMLREVGIDLEIPSFDADLFFDSYSNGSPAALGEVDIMEWSDRPAFPDPDFNYWLCSEMVSDDNPWGYNYFGCDEALDALFQEQLLTVDPEARAAIFQQITKHIHENVYWLGIWQDPDVWLIGDRLTNVQFSGVTPFTYIAEWEVK